MKIILKWIGILMVGLVIVILLSGVAFFVKGGKAITQTFTIATPAIEAATDSVSIARGARLANVLGCVDCHGSKLEGSVMIDAPPFLIVSSNLTPGRGGVGSAYSTADFDHAIRHGIRPDGTPLVFMPSRAFHEIADDEAAAILGYLKSLPPVDNELPKTTFRPLGQILAGAGQIDVTDEVTESDPALTTAPTVEQPLVFGNYRAMTCKYCHNEDLSGGLSMGPGVVSSDIRSYGKLPVDVFISTLRSGRTPAGRQMDSTYMPYSIFKYWTEEELSAVHAYIASL